MKGKLYLVPSPLGGPPEEVIPSVVFERISHIEHFAVEEIRSGRRYLSSIGFKGRIDTLHFYEINEHSGWEDAQSVVKILLSVLMSR